MSRTVLFLQDRRKNTPATVSINDIYRGPLRRHRRSLKKLLIDSSEKIPRAPGASNDSTRWRTWMLNHDVLAYVTSGNMSSLRELSVAIEYKDWVSFYISSLIRKNMTLILAALLPAPSSTGSNSTVTQHSLYCRSRNSQL
jgi:hypothetical protein